MKTWKAKLKKRNALIGWSMVIISAVLVIVFNYIPMIQSFVLSLNTGKGNNLTFSGFANYVKLFKDPAVRNTIWNTVLYVLFQLPVMTILALVLAVLLNDPKLKFRGFFRTCIFLPCVTSLVACGVLFKKLFSADGLINSTLLSLNIIDESIPWLMDPFWSKVVIVIVLIWRWTGYYMIFYLAALQNVDNSIYEAAEIDGANFFQKLFRITLPVLKPIILLTSILATNSTLQLFDEVVNLTNGGPGNATRTISQYIYDISFNFVPQYGYAAAISYVVFIIVALLTIVQRKMAGKDNE